MRTRHVVWLSTLLVGFGGCGGEGASTSPSGTCEDGLARLQACVDDHCDGSSSKTCESFQTTRSGSLHGTSANPCESMTQSAVDRLLTASCDELLTEAGLVLDGKADGDCPPYFPWCAEVGENATGYSVRVESFGPGTITLDVSIRDLTYASVMLEGQAFHELSLDAAGRAPGIGKPTVPSIGLMIGVPGGTDTAWVESFDVKETAVLSDLRLAPLQKMTVEDAPAPDFAWDAAAYGLDAPHPGYRHEVDPIATWRNFRVVRVHTFPAQYNPVRRELEIATRYTVVVRFDDVQAEPVDTVDDGRSAFSEAYDETLVNYYEATDDAPAPAPVPDRTRYLFIVADALAEAIAPLVSEKEVQGVKTEVVLLSTLLEGEGALTDRIKEAIRLRYEKDAIEYVLLVGEPEDIPLYLWGGKQSDVWYGCLAGEDSLPEVAVGRMMGKTPEELTVHVEKTLAHHATVAQENDWRHRVLLVAHEQQYPKKYTECLDSVVSAEYRTDKVEFNKLYGGENATNEQVVEQINRGVGIVNYRGHGTEERWHEWNHHDFRVDESPLTNADKLPVIFSIACLNSAFQSEQATMAEHWVHFAGGGAVGVLGATQPSYTLVNHDFNRYLFQALLTEGVQEIGMLINRANAKLFNQYGEDNMALANMRMYTWLGDPSLRIGDVFAVPPLPPEPGAIIINEVMAHVPDGLEGDTNGDGIREFKDDEFIELVNTGAGATDISGWSIADKVGIRFTFPEGTIIPPGKALVVFGGGEPKTFADMGGSQVIVAPSGLKLNDDGDSIMLVKADERVDGMEYKAALAAGGSMVRAVDGDGTTAFERHSGQPPYSPGRKRDGSSF